MRGERGSHKQWHMSMERNDIHCLGQTDAVETGYVQGSGAMAENGMLGRPGAVDACRVTQVKKSLLPE